MSGRLRGSGHTHTKKLPDCTKYRYFDHAIYYACGGVCWSQVTQQLIITLQLCSCAAAFVTGCLKQFRLACFHCPADCS